MATLVTANNGYANVIGTDGQSPIYNPEGRFQTYAMRQLWIGESGPGANRYVPNIGDIVFDVYGETRSPCWRVVSLDVNYVPRMVVFDITAGTNIDEGDYLTGIGGTKASSTYRIYIDKSVTPYAFAVDARLITRGTAARSAIIFRGNPSEGNTLEAISLFYDNAGNLLGNTIPLELVGVNAQTQRVEYCTPVAYTKEDLPDNELVTIVFYSAEGHVVGRNELLVMNSSFIRSRNLSIKYVTGISLKTPFMSAVDPKLIELPMNVPLNGLLMIGRAHYSNGEVNERAIDGSKFRVDGLTGFMATVINQQVPINLVYNLAPDEIAYGAYNTGATKHMAETYKIKTIPSKGAYYLKLYCYPTWVSISVGYTLRWFLYNADRNQRYEVTDLIKYVSTSNGFDPKAYGIMQNLNVQLDLAKVNAVYDDYRYAQTIGVLLRREGQEHETKWSVLFTPGQDPAYGFDQYCELERVNWNYFRLRLKGSSQNYEEWLERCYHQTQPLVDPRRETVAPLPTHFRLRLPTGVTVSHPIESWNKVVVTSQGWDPYTTLVVEWIRKTPEADLELGCTGFPIRPAEDLPDPNP